MRTLDAASLDALKQREGCKLTAYRDVGGTLTIGYGDTQNVTEGQTITQAEADARLAKRLEEFEDCVNTFVHVPLTDNQFGALVSFCYNIGTQAFTGSTLLRKLNANDYESVPAEMLKWVNVNHVRSQGLVNRRNSEGGQWVRGAYVTSASITPDAPAPWWKTGAMGRIVGALGSGAAGIYSHVVSGDVQPDNVKAAAAAAKEAASTWHSFGTIAAILSFVFVVWLIFDHKKEGA